MKFTPATIPDILLIDPDIYEDKRGFFFESYHLERFQRAGIIGSFVQDNHSGSAKGVLRGLHYQINRPQGKLIKIVIGTIYDVCVDLRKNSPTFAQWIGIELAAETHQQLWIPPGFAHGFYVLSEWAEVIYKTTDYYSPKDERTIAWNDPDLNIDWHLNSTPVLSEKDSHGLSFSEAPKYNF